MAPAVRSDNDRMEEAIDPPKNFQVKGAIMASNFLSPDPVEKFVDNNRFFKPINRFHHWLFFVQDYSDFLLRGELDLGPLAFNHAARTTVYGF